LPSAFRTRARIASRAERLPSRLVAAIAMRGCAV
jgi:hypothetical protein